MELASSHDDHGDEGHVQDGTIKSISTVFVHEKDSSAVNAHNDGVDEVEFGFASCNRLQLLVHWFLAVLIGVSLRMTTFPEAMIAAELGVDHYTRETSFLVAFGVTKALSNLMVGWVSDRYGRKTPHAIGWALGVILGILLLSATAHTENMDGSLCSSCWMRYVIANIFLGAQQGMAWTTNIFMFLDILGPRHRALASGISNSTGYIASALITYAAALLAPNHAFGVVLMSTLLGLVISIVFIKDTKQFVTQEEDAMEMLPIPTDFLETNNNVGENRTGESGMAVSKSQTIVTGKSRMSPSFGTVFATTCWHNKSTAVVCLSGLMTNLVTSLAWGLVMIWGKQQQSLDKFRLAQIASAFTFTKAISQIIMSSLSDRYFRRKCVLIVGFVVTAAGLVVTAMAGLVQSASIVDSSNNSTNSNDGSLTDYHDDSSYKDHWIYVFLLVGGIIIGFGIGSVYCVMTGAISDHTVPLERASAIGVYKLWRDSGYAVGGLLTGAVADVSGGSFVTTTLVVAGLVILLVLLLALGYREAPCGGGIMAPNTMRTTPSSNGGGRGNDNNKSLHLQELQTLRCNPII